MISRMSAADCRACSCLSDQTYGLHHVVVTSFLFFNLALEVKVGLGWMLSHARQFPALFTKRVQFGFVERLLILKVPDDLFVFPFQFLFDVNHWRANGFVLLWFSWRNKSMLHT